MSWDILYVETLSVTQGLSIPLAFRYTPVKNNWNLFTTQNSYSFFAVYFSFYKRYMWSGPYLLCIFIRFQSLVILDLSDIFKRAIWSEPDSLIHAVCMSMDYIEKFGKTTFIGM